MAWTTPDGAPSLPRPPRPPFIKERSRNRSIFAPARRMAKLALLKGIDAGWFGYVPLDAHVTICGFPRSGTTLLLLMMEAAYPDAWTFHHERPALGAIHNEWPGRHRLLITKRPNDIFWLDEIRAAYRHRRTRPLFVLSVRDPRAVLTSVHNRNRSAYWVPPARWRAVYEHVMYNRQFGDVLFVEYADLVERPATVEQQLMDFVGHSPLRRFEDFQEAVPNGFDETALNGLRALDRSTLDRWRAKKHRHRIREILRELPDLPERLIQLGYESDDSWVRAYV